MVVLAHFQVPGDRLTPRKLGGALLGERTIYLARAVQRIDPTNLLLAQAVIGSAGLASRGS